jgi:cell division protein ZapA
MAMDAASAEKKLVRVTIFQQLYTLRSSGSAGETEALADAVDSLMSQIAARSPGMDSTRAAVLAALHLADQAHQREQAYARLQARLESIEAELDRLIDDARG